MMKPAPKSAELTHTLACFDVRDCDCVGRVLFPPETDRSIEARFFSGWNNILLPALQRLATKMNTSALLQVVEDQGRHVLEWPELVPCLLAAGNQTWADYEIACDVRCVLVRGFPYHHDETTFDSQGRTGVALRIQDARRHYFAGFEGERKLVIAVRDDARWIVLANADFELDQRRYHHLGVRCVGKEISISVDGARLLSAEDGRWRSGAAGLYTNVLCRWAQAEIRCAPAEQRSIASRQAKQEKTHATARSKVPQPQTVLEIDLPAKSDAAGPARFGCALGENIVVDWAEFVAGKTAQVMLAMDLKGREVWRRHFAAPGEFFYASNDLDDDGKPEIVLLDGKRMYVLDGSTGQSRFEADYPDGTPFYHLRGQKARFNWRCPKIWRTGGAHEPARIYLFEFTGSGGHTIWSYDHQLRPRWVHQNYSGKFGHDLTHYDVDGDGRKEIVAGYYTLNDEGKCVWRIEDQDMIYKQEHTDNLWAGQMGDERSIPKVIAVAGGSGVLFLDARNGKLLKRLDGIGHMQRIAVGRFRHDLPGRQAWVWTDWGSPGIYSLLDENGSVMHRFQPDPRCTDGQTVTWWPDGRDLLLMRATPDVRGLWDAFGFKVADLSKLTGKAEIHKARVTTTATDQLVIVEGARLRIIGPKS